MFGTRSILLIGQFSLPTYDFTTRFEMNRLSNTGCQYNVSNPTTMAAAQSDR